MADYQYLPDINDPVTKLRIAMSHMDGKSLLKLITEIDRIVVDGLRSYTIPTEPFNPSTSQADAVDTDLDPELHTSLEGLSYVRSLRAFPPPLFSRQGIPQGYKCVVLTFNAKFTLKYFLSFRANTASIITTTTDEETGEERKRMINRMRWKGYGPASVMFSDSQVRLNMCRPLKSHQPFAGA